MSKTKGNLIMIGIIIAIIAVIVLIIYLKDNGSGDEKTMQCIADNSLLYVSTTCGHCARQKQILGDSLDKFNLIDCNANASACIDSGIMSVPTWVIDNSKYSGVKSIEELKQLTGC